jgi:3-keto-5-aminohexanoate cleavage enzyme
LITTDKLIICVAPCGSFLTKRENPAMPVSPEEIAEEIYRSWNVGASIAHIHGRDKEGKATTNPAVFKEIKRLIRQKGCDIVLNFSTSPGREPSAKVEDGFKVVEAGPEIATDDVGVMVFTREGKEHITPWTRAFNKKLTQILTENGVKPEFEVFGVGGIMEVTNIIDKIPNITKPYWFDLCLGMQKTAQNVTPYSPQNIMHMVSQLPSDSMFISLGVGAVETATVVQSMLLGGHARVGFEDNYYYRKGVLAKSNAELVERVAKIGIELGRTVASPEETRALLGIPLLNSK